MADLIQYKLVKGSKNWQAFFNGQITAEQFLVNMVGENIAEEVNQETENIAVDVTSMFEETAEGWDHPVDFNVKVESKIDNQLKSRIVLSMTKSGAGAQFWDWIDEGTSGGERHASPDNKSGMMIREYSPGTTPGSIKGGKGRYTGKILGRKQVIYNPGIRARKFTEKIVQYLKGNHEDGYSRRIQKALARAARRIERSG